jgi:hypothetical protein
MNTKKIKALGNAFKKMREYQSTAANYRLSMAITDTLRR